MQQSKACYVANTLRTRSILLQYAARDTEGHINHLWNILIFCTGTYVLVREHADASDIPDIQSYYYHARHPTMGTSVVLKNDYFLNNRK